MVYRVTRAKSSLFHSHLDHVYVHYAHGIVAICEQSTFFMLQFLPWILHLSLLILIPYINCACNAAKGPWSNWKFISLTFSLSLSPSRITSHYSPFCALIRVLLSRLVVGTHAVIMTKFIQYTIRIHIYQFKWKPAHACCHSRKQIQSFPFFLFFFFSFPSLNLFRFVHIAHPFLIFMAHSLFIPN